MTEVEPVMRFLTQSDVSRRGGIPLTTVNGSVLRGTLKPDAYGGKAPLFKADNPSVRALTERLGRRK